MTIWEYCAIQLNDVGYTGSEYKVGSYYQDPCTQLSDFHDKVRQLGIEGWEMIGQIKSEVWFKRQVNINNLKSDDESYLSQKFLCPTLDDMDSVPF